jgi:ABC-2 type transport system permease protein
MTFYLWQKLLRDIRTSLLVVFLLLMGFQVFWVMITKRVTTEFSPLFSGIAGKLKVSEDAFQEFFFRGPGKVMQSIMGGENIRINHPQDMLAVGYLHPLIQFIFCIWAIGRASGAIAGEIDKGTMELLLAQPMARSKIILAHFLVDLTVIPLLAFALFLGTVLGTVSAGPFTIDESHFKMFSITIPLAAQTLEVHPNQLAPSMWNIGALLFALSGITMWISSAGRFRNRVIGIAVLITLIQFLINVIGQLWEPLSFLRPFTVFYYYQPQQLSLHHDWTVNPGNAWGGSFMEVNVVLVLCFVGILGYLMAWRIFTRRDIPAPL